ncbi:monocarboxylate transporter 10 isoform X1 [Neodiprion lecontei]|uniref:Monocarboxylate transporter 10 isoform X1 n=1 Tax=Neodiprion lecontei TaxID=441921 RepID=A0A6J0C1Z6_NEOLC|nr:monocarboxylate transporter 10 isoform X1 [Neodiprion lecontei]XP_046591799.1 monocarboxylate transporter 10 isoform X1 [Neodiprion lecontei]XP_046591800.1 monocarboxylate transporter 10 isoform X1 [Neodiprion lecontei]XP_046591801.1 monocarboxylate transporter 10 isoform X1 [Neodiprion lecontei]
MTVTESGEGKQASVPDLYSQLRGAAAEIDERASSEESQSAAVNANGIASLPREIGPAPTDAERGASIPSSYGWSNPLSNDATVVGVAEELAPLNQTANPTVLNAHGGGALKKMVGPMSAEVKAEPPDGGCRAWVIMVASFFVNGIILGVINSASVIHIQLEGMLKSRNVTGASSKASLVTSLAIGMMFLMSPVAGILTDKIGVQMTTLLGGGLATLGLFISSFIWQKIEVMYLTYAIMYGLGASLAYTPSLVILGHYFKRRSGLVNGIVTAGSSAFTVAMPYVMQALLDSVGMKGLLISLAALTAGVMACAVLFKPLLPPSSSPERCAAGRFNFQLKLKEVINISMWKRKRYVIWATAIPLALFGYFVPYVHIGAFVKKNFTGHDEKLPVMCIAITSGVGRLLFGFVADLPRVNRILLQQISFVTIGLLTMLLPVTNSFNLLLVISLGMGLVDGCFISLLGPIAFDICGQKDASQAIGFLLGMCSIPLTVGPPIAGYLFDSQGSYTLAFILAGVPPIVGAIVMFLVRFVDDNTTGCGKDETEPSECLHQPLAQPAWQNGNGIKLGPGGAREEPWSCQTNHIGDEFGKRIDNSVRRCPSYRYDCYYYFYRNCKRQNMHKTTSLTPDRPRRGCQLVPHDIARYSESEPLLLCTTSTSCSNKGAKWNWSLHDYRDDYRDWHYSENSLCQRES